MIHHKIYLFQVDNSVYLDFPFLGIFHMDLCIEYVFCFCIWLLSLCVIFLRLIHVVACVSIFIPLCSTSLYGNIPFDLSIYHHFLAIVNNNTLNIDGQVFEWMFLFLLGRYLGVEFLDCN